MKLIMFSIYDVASGAYSRPFYGQSESQAIRSFTDIATDATHEIGKHPEDYTLYRVGQWDDQKAALMPEDATSLATAQEVIAASRKISPGSLKDGDET